MPVEGSPFDVQRGTQSLGANRPNEVVAQLFPRESVS